MKKQIPAILLTLICAGLAVALYTSHQKIAALELQLSSASPDPAEQPATPAATILTEPVAQTILDPLEVATQEAMEILAEEEPESNERRMMKNLAKLMENPAMNKMIEASQRGAVSSMYEDLMQQFNLTADEKEYFMDLLMFRQMTQVDVGMKMMAGNLSGEEQAELQAQLEDATNLVKTEMKNFLNSDEDYENFEFFENTTGERMMLSQAESSLTGTDQAFSEATYHDLVEMMVEQKERFPFTSSLHDADNTDLSPETFSSQNLERYKRDQDQLNGQILSNAQDMLTEEQFAAFEDALNSFTDLQNTQLDMAAQMLGGGE